MSDYQHIEFSVPSRWMEQTSQNAKIPSSLTIYDGTSRRILTTAGLSPSVDLGLNLDADKLASAQSELHSRLSKLTVDPDLLADEEVSGIRESAAQGC